MNHERDISKNNKRRSERVCRQKLIALAVCACFSMGVAHANPTNPTVTNGAAQFTTVGNLLTVTNTPNTIINWNSFSIGAGEITRFIQQSGASAVLNRVGAGRDPSSILGSLQSNGRVFLINPNGITFGAGSQINVAGLVASSLNLSDADFLAGRMRFTDGLGNSVINNGNITTSAGGSVYLVGNAITNNGIITSPKGEVILAAGNSVELVNPGTPDLRVEIVAPDNQAVNLGQIVADSGRIGIYAGLISHSGTVNANSVDVDAAGNITLKATQNIDLGATSRTTANGPTGGNITLQSGDTTLVAGTIEAKGGTGQGGTVNVLGNLVGLTGSANIDTSGDTGGGTVMIGGDYQGKNTTIQNAYRTYVGGGTTIKADAVTSGNGGKVIVWGDDVTRFYGDISARGGVQAGDGGFVEVSGKNALSFAGVVNTSAPKGAIGQLLLDPTDITIVATTAVPANAADGTWSFAEDTGAQTIGADAINTLLSGTSNLTLQATNNINVTSAISWTTALKLTLQANNDLTVGANITNSLGPNIGSSAIQLQAGRNLIINNGVTITARGSDTIGGSAQVDLIGGNNVTINGSILADGGSGIGAGNATLNVTSSNGNISAGSSSQLHAAGGAGTGRINLTAKTGIGATGAPVRIDDASPTMVATNGSGGGSGNIVLSQISGAVNLNGSLQTLTNSAAGGGIDYTAEAGNVSVGFAFSNPNGPITLRSTQAGGNVDISAAGSVRGNGINLIADNVSIAGAVTANAGFGVVLQPFDNNRSMSIVSGARLGGGTFSLLTSELQQITGDSLTFGPASSASSTGSLTIATALDSTVVRTSQLELRSGSGGITISNNIDMGAGVLDATGGAVTFSGSPITISSTNAAGFLAGTISAGGSGSSVTLNANTVVNGGPAAPTGSVGTLNIASGKTLTMQGGAVNAGTLNLSGTYTVGSGTSSFSTVNIASGGLLKGSGTLNGSVNNSGTVAPGTSPGVLTIAGNYTQAASGLLQLELGGLAPGGGHDQLIVTGNAVLDGALQVLQFGSFAPGLLDKFQVLTVGGTITGTFSSVSVPLLFTGLGPAYATQSVSLGGAVGFGGALLDPQLIREDKDVFALVEDVDIFKKLQEYLTCN